MAKTDRPRSRHGWLSFNLTAVLDLFMLATFVFALNVDRVRRTAADELREMNAAAERSAREKDAALAHAQAELAVLRAARASASEGTSAEAESRIVATVCTTGDGRVFWQNNHQWSSCSGRDGDTLDDLLARMSLPDGVKVRVDFVGFYNCRAREEGLLAKLRKRFGADNVFHPARRGFHLMYVTGNGDMVAVDNRNGVSLAEIDRVVKACREEDEEDFDAVSTFTYYIVCPAANRDQDDLRAAVVRAYGDRAVVELLRY